MPMGHTVIDFWRMVYEHNSQSIIMLNPVDADEVSFKYNNIYVCVCVIVCMIVCMCVFVCVDVCM